MSTLNYLVIEYVPHLMDGQKLTPARIDGHYASEEIATEVAELWADAPMHAESRIVVAEVKRVLKQPAHWIEQRETMEASR